ncbi:MULTISPECIES: branched-chain amino acid ABC transporter substrate-binding protein [Pseudomonas]|jgi:branched-chain amino acid transport system substrate-binding protein|uniref:Amino acid/amide ABC transporter substrate-binding protein (HAAT family) n=2 Tax=Pseudomonas TaxID=286 RepID=A0A9X8EFH9_PSEPU|nr:MULTISPECIES: branched-chain amino acid ABC transporter substrate-binding protein [Pseudomonas]KIU45133.1 amino acid ABC transporter substrate-binding protein [Pseudomonas putida]KTC25193.1 amino acid ABC transporter substrate-binding protein [Pseudomonas putida]MBG8561191.1 branched-chain amino acid ABC transporter substrate-binding protein [Pseudomonas qingdaonensis]MCO7505503.1 branched-chain amino acid ABC transporter substrate-binding protein [Pseudomonas sp. VE 267-6A]MCO7528380.1 bra
MNKNNRGLTALAALMATLIGAGTANAADTQLVRIGFAGPLTGPSAHQGLDVEHGVSIAIEEANQQQLKLGDKVAQFKLVSEDDVADPRTGTAVAQRLVDSKVAVVIGHYNSGTSIPASKIYADAGIPQISPSATNPALTRQGIKTVFRVVNDDATLGRYAGNYLVKTLQAQRIAIFDDRTAYGQGLADEVTKAVKAAGGNVVVREYTNDKSTDFNAILTTAKSQKVDAVFFAALDYQAAPMAKQMKNLGLKARFMNIGNLPNDEFKKMAGSAAEGVYAWNYGTPLLEMPKGAAFEQKLKAKFGTGVVQSSPAAYDATWAAITAMVKAQSADPAVYLPVLKSESYEGVTGTIAFDEFGNLKSPAATVFQFADGGWKTLSVERD